MRRQSFALFVLLFLISSLFAGLAYRFIEMSVATAACRQHPDDDTFLAYCETPAFGHYEQGAYYLDLEPDAVDALRRAEVISFGTSREQHAFSTDIVRDYFRARQVRFYALGFSYVEPAALPLALIRNEELKPRIAIIVADDFFAPSPGSPAIRALISEGAPIADRATMFLNYLTKWLIVAGWMDFCAVLPGACPQRFAAIHRHRSDGTWIWRDLYAADISLPIPDDPTTLRTYPVANVARDRQRALQFLQEMDVSPVCAVITATPTRHINFQDYATELGRSIGASVIMPRLADLAAIDNDHLNWESARRWSAAFLAEFDDVLRRCVTGDRQAK